MASDDYVSMAIKVRLQRLGITQEDLAAKSGINANQLSKYISGKVSWKIEYLDKLLTGLKWGSVADIMSAAETERQIHDEIVAIA